MKQKKNKEKQETTHQRKEANTRGEEMKRNSQTKHHYPYVEYATMLYRIDKNVWASW